MKAYAEIRGGDRKVRNIISRGDLPISFALCTNSKEPI